VDDAPDERDAVEDVDVHVKVAVESSQLLALEQERIESAPGECSVDGDQQ